jgi:kinesin family protein 15
LGRLASSELLRAASSPTGAAAKCAETLKKTFSSSSKAANISVYVRVRPTVTRRSNNQQNEQEEENNENMENKHPDETEPIEEPSFTVESDSTLIHRISGQQGKRFLMDKIFEEESTQEEVFERIGRAQVDKAMSGFHGSIFAYGQTSTGKTYTMLGPNGGRGDLSSPEISRDIGLIPRILHYLFQKVRSQDDNKNDNSSEQNRVQKVTVSYLEIYNETLRDLLNEDSEEGHNLPIKEHKRDGPFVKGLTEKVVTCPDEALSLMEIGNAARSQAKTRMNDTSSRSHAVFTIRVDGQMCSATADGRRRKFTSKMNLVDLAGSERQRNTGAEGKRLREGSAINKSLSVLGTVIMNLVDIGDGRSRHVHYRDSKLTFLLRDSLGGSTYTSIIATVTSKEEHAQETLSTLHFAQRAKSVKNVVTRNVEVIDTVSGLRRELRSLKKQLKRSESTGSNQMSTSEDQGSDTAVRTELNEHIRKAVRSFLHFATCNNLIIILLF